MGRDVLGIIQSINNKNYTWYFVGFYDDSVQKKKLMFFPILGKVEDLNFLDEELSVAIGIDNPTLR